MTTTIEITEADLRKLVIKELNSKLNDIKIDETHVNILVKSKQNYRAEWEAAAFKASITVNS